MAHEEQKATGKDSDVNKQAGAGSEGCEYEWLLAGFSLLTWPKEKGNIDIATNVDNMGKLDDIVFFDVTNKKTQHVQLKHGRTGGDITLKKLLGSKSKSERGILRDLFESFRLLKQNQEKDWAIERLIFFTVRKLYDNDKTYVIDRHVDPQVPDASLPLLNFLMSGDGTQAKSYKLNLQIVRDSETWKEHSFWNTTQVRC